MLRSASCSLLVAASFFPTQMVMARSQADNGTFGSYRKQPHLVAAQLVPGRGGEFVLQPTVFPASGIGLRTKGDYLLDRDLRDRIQTRLMQNGQPIYESLAIHVSPCYGGGFIDELEEAAFPNLSINTSAAWDKMQWGIERNDHPTDAPKGPRGYYSREWIDALSAGNAGKLKDVYTMVLPGNGQADFWKNPYPQVERNKERPQYFAPSNAADDIRIGVATDQKLALIFVGDDRDWKKQPDDTWQSVRGQRWYRDALTMYDKLKGLGYSDDSIEFYYHDGTTPDGGTNAIIDKAATKANFNTFFRDFVPARVAGQNDQVTLYLGGHGTLQDDVIGKLKMTPPAIPPPPGFAPLRTTFQFDVGRDALDTMSSEFSGNETMVLRGEPLENMNLGETVEVFVSDPSEIHMSSIGTLDYSASLNPWQLEFGRSIMDPLVGAGGVNGTLELIFAGSNAQTIIGDFSLISEGVGLTSVPEPAALGLVGALMLASRRPARRRDHFGKGIGRWLA